MECNLVYHNRAMRPSIKLVPVRKRRNIWDEIESREGLSLMLQGLLVILAVLLAGLIIIFD